MVLLSSEAINSLKRAMANSVKARSLMPRLLEYYRVLD